MDVEDKLLTLINSDPLTKRLVLSFNLEAVGCDQVDPDSNSVAGCVAAATAAAAVSEAGELRELLPLNGAHSRPLVPTESAVSSTTTALPLLLLLLLPLLRNLCVKYLLKVTESKSVVKNI